MLFKKKKHLALSDTAFKSVEQVLTLLSYYACEITFSSIQQSQNQAQMMIILQNTN
jgi:uncharacterized membrane-anchored protein YitT (DUF2179 family)